MNSDNNSWPLPWAEPEEVGISSKRLSRIKPVLQQYIDDGHAPNFGVHAFLEVFERLVYQSLI
jgi:hypothetical protein